MPGAKTAARRVVTAAALALVAAAVAWDPRAEAAAPKRVLGLVVASAALAVWTVRPTRGWRGAWGSRAGLVFFVLSAASLAWGLPSGARDLGTLAAALGAGAIGAQLGPRLGVRTARLAAIVTGGAISVWAAAQAIGGARGMQIHAGQGNPNWLGLLLALTLPLTLDALAARRRAAIVFVAAAQVIALYLSHSRVAWAAVALVGSLQLLLAVRGRARRALVVAAAILACAVPVAASAEVRDVPAQLALEGRAWIWRITATAASRALPFGVGLGRFGHAYLDAQGAELAGASPPEAARRFVNATTAHQEYLQAAIESGPLAAFALACALLLGALGHARARWFGGAATLGACAITALGDSPLHQPAAAMLVGLVLGVPIPSPARARRRVPALIPLALVAWLLQSSVRDWIAERARARALDEDPAGRAALLARAARVDPASGEGWLDLGLARLELHDPAGACAALRRADASFADVSARIALGGAELARGDAAAAEAAYRAALGWSPGSFRARAGLAEALLARGDLDAAEREALVAHRVLPGDARAGEILDRIREAKMDWPR